MQLSPKQERALNEVSQWYKEANFRERPFFYLGGYAGTGKTTIESKFSDDVEGRVVRACYTGKAALRMQQLSGKAASTIHSIAYTVDKEERDTSGNMKPKFTLNKIDSPLLKAKLLVLDECSMVDDKTGDDLLSFGVPILVLGDPGQLPPIKGTGYFTKRRPDIMLDEVHRQALDSPIIRVATTIRNGEHLGRMNEEGCLVYPFAKDYDMEAEYLLADQLLTGTNKIRVKVNKRVRELEGYDTKTDGGYYPTVGDKLICLRNNRKSFMFNGMQSVVTNVRKSDAERVYLDMETDLKKMDKVDIHPECFTDMKAIQEMRYMDRSKMEEFDYGYCITVHKSQGSQWDKVTVLDDGFLNWRKEDRAKWLYTAVTRAVSKLTVLNART